MDDFQTQPITYHTSSSTHLCPPFRHRIRRLDRPLCFAVPELSIGLLLFVLFMIYDLGGVFSAAIPSAFQRSCGTKSGLSLSGKLLSFLKNMASNNQTSLILASATTGGVNALLSFRVLKSLLTLLNAVLILLLFPPWLCWRNGVSFDQKLLKEEKLDIGTSHQLKEGPVALRVSAGIVSRKNNPALDNQLIGPGGQESQLVEHCYLTGDEGW